MIAGSFGTTKKLSSNCFPGHCPGSTGIQFRYTALDFLAPRFFDVRIDLGLETFNQQAGEGGPFTFRQV